MMTDSINNSDHESWYRLNKVIGNGSFGIVHEAYLLKTNEQVAIKKVLQDPRYKNRELTIMKDLRHPNIIKLRDYYFTVQYNNSTSTTTPSNNQTKPNSKSNGEEKYLNLVMEYMPDTVHKVMRTYFKSLGFVPLNLIRTYAFQICRAFGYLHSMNVCHRDLKPHNLLVDPFTNVLKLCDFGSAKKLIKGDWSVSYICSRFYRAPELMLGSNEYTTAIDAWSIGCVLSELLLGRPIFCGDTSIDQLVKIIQILGTPSILEMKAMNPDYNNINFPNLKRVELSTIFPKNTDPDLINLISNLLRYNPTERLKPLDALTHVFFKPLIIKTANHINCTSRDNINTINTINTMNTMNNMSTRLVGTVGTGSNVGVGTGTNVGSSGISDELIVDIINPNLVPNNLLDFTPEEVNYMSTHTKEYFNLI